MEAVKNWEKSSSPRQQSTGKEENTLCSREEPSGVEDVECRDSLKRNWRDPGGKERRVHPPGSRSGAKYRTTGEKALEREKSPEGEEAAR